MSDHIQGFSSWEEMDDYMNQREAEANSRVTDTQRTINPGDFVVRPIEVGGIPTLIVGKTFSVNQFLDAERSEGADDEELAYASASYKQRIGRGYLFGRWYSILEQAGEYGDAHISTLYPIPETDYHDYLHLIRDGRDPFALWYIRRSLNTGETSGTSHDPGPKDS